MVLVLDDHPLARHGLCAILRTFKDNTDVLEAGTVRESISLMESNPVDLVLVDLHLGAESGFDLLRWMQEHKKTDTVKKFVITSSTRQGDFDRAKQLDVDAYVLKDAFIDDILYGLRVLERGGKFYSPSLVEGMSRQPERKNNLHLLTQRELDVLQLIGKGYSNAQISKTLFITEGTTKKHISNILSKLYLENRVDAIFYCQEHMPGLCLRKDRRGPS